MSWVFTPWGPFKAFRVKSATTSFMRDVANNSYRILREGLKNPPKTGEYYHGKSGRRVRASVNRNAAEYPAMDTGALYRSAGKTSSAARAEIGTNMFYSKFLREGTKKMRRRKMSDTAMRQGIDQSRRMMKHWVVWKLGN